MDNKPNFGEMLLGVEGLALLRLAFTDDPAARRARVREIVDLVADIDTSPDFTAPLRGPEYDLDEGYRLWSQTYDRRLRLFPIEEPVVSRILDDLPAHSSVLDAACGTGRYAAYLAGRGHPVVGVDRSPDMLALARAKVPGSQFLEGDLAALPVENGSADAAICTLALVHLENIEGAVDELARAVRPGGRVIISDVNPVPILLGWQAQFHTADGEGGFIRIYPHLPSEYLQAFAHAGLRVRTCVEPLLTPEAAQTPAAERLPEANHAAWVGLPALIIWDLEKPST